jgi:hypothetical protein
MRPDGTTSDRVRCYDGPGGPQALCQRMGDVEACLVPFE